MSSHFYPWPEPRPEDFDTEEEYIKDLNAWEQAILLYEMQHEGN